LLQAMLSTPKLPRFEPLIRKYQLGISDPISNAKIMRSSSSTGRWLIQDSSGEEAKSRAPAHRSANDRRGARSRTLKLLLGVRLPRQRGRWLVGAKAVIQSLWSRRNVIEANPLSLPQGRAIYKKLHFFCLSVPSCGKASTSFTACHQRIISDLSQSQRR